MTCNTIYETALALLGEVSYNGSCSDYEERAPYLLRMIITRLAVYSKFLSGTEAELEELTLESEFPLDLRLAPCASEMLASMLIFDEMPELSRDLMEYAENDRELVEELSIAPDIGTTREVY